MPKGLWIKDGPRAIPADERSLEFLQAQRDGQPFLAETKSVRNPKQLRLWWALMYLCAEQLDKTPDALSDAIKVTLGHFETIAVPGDDRVYIKPASIAFESMPQETFNNLLTAAINKLAEWIGSAPADLRQRFNEITADKRYLGMMR